MLSAFHFIYFCNHPSTQVFSSLAALIHVHPLYIKRWCQVLFMALSHISILCVLSSRALVWGLSAGALHRCRISLSKHQCDICVFHAAIRTGAVHVYANGPLTPALTNYSWGMEPRPSLHPPVLIWVMAKWMNDPFLITKRRVGACLGGILKQK